MPHIPTQDTSKRVVYEINTGTHVRRNSKLKICLARQYTSTQHTGVNVVSTESSVWKDYMYIFIPWLRSANLPKI
jgi:hypothetical protein